MDVQRVLLLLLHHILSLNSVTHACQAGQQQADMFILSESPDFYFAPQQLPLPEDLCQFPLKNYPHTLLPPLRTTSRMLAPSMDYKTDDRYSPVCIGNNTSDGGHHVSLLSDYQRTKYSICESLLLLAGWRGKNETLSDDDASEIINIPCWEIGCVPCRIVDCYPVCSIEEPLKCVSHIVWRSADLTPAAVGADSQDGHFLAQEGVPSDGYDYELVYPVTSRNSRSNVNGSSQPDSGIRSKRSTSKELTNETELIIQAFGKNFEFDWISDAPFARLQSILTPGFVVQRIGNRTTWLDAEATRQDASWVDNCLRVGLVNGDIHSTAVMDLCWDILHNLNRPLQEADRIQRKSDRRGLMGAFHYKNAGYTLQPAGIEFPSPEHSSSLPPHIVHRIKYNGPSSSDSRKEQSSFPHWDSLRTARRKREVDPSEFAVGAWEYHVELLVVADYSMRQFHGKDLDEYILTLMSIVGVIYRDASIGSSLTISVAKLVTLESENEGPRVSWSAQDTLESFCKWQSTYNSQEDSDPHHHDAAILITRQDLCRVKNKCDTLGLAEIGTMCDAQKSCAIVEDSGLSSAFTIAHELGHLFNLPHDDDRTCSKFIPTGTVSYTNVMAPRLDHNSNPWTWSPCSAKRLLDYLESGEASCLLDEPSPSNSVSARRAYLTQSRGDYQLERMSVNSFLFPGEMFEVDKQCQLVFGEGSTVCPFMPVCKRLWCTTSLGNQTGCRTQHLPWADGTSCGWNMWCKRGECVKKDFTRLDPVDGGWGPWSRWGQCSRTCGGGIKESTRDCNNPKPLNGGKYCVGQRIRYKSCNVKDCGHEEMDFREEQCAAFNGKTMGYQGVEPNVLWTAKLYGQTSRQKCKLYCQVEGTNKFFLLKDKVIDGTPCGVDSTDICVNGICKKAGCDGKLGSQLRRDMCGVCGGDNSTCRAVSGNYNEQKYGYNFIVEIPEGASNIDIRQHGHQGMKDDYNYLALANSKGQFLFNGDFIVSIFRKEVSVKNAMIDYTGSDTVVERINCTAAIGEKLSLYVLSVGNLYPPDVYYSYMISVGDEYRWDPEGSWNACNKECRGQQQRNLICVRKNDRQVVPKGHCVGQSSPEEHTRSCNEHCSLRWDVQEDPDAQCSAKCNEIGTIRRRVRCLKETHDETPRHAETKLHFQETLSTADQQRVSPTTQEVEVEKCNELSDPKPADERPCTGSCRVVAWRYTDWNECSRQCGGGTQTRASVCVDLTTGQQVQPFNCSLHQPPEPSQRSCNPQPCAADWTVGPWSACSVTCGPGVMHRAVKCLMRAEGTEADDALCDPLRKPPVKIRCPEVPCPPPMITRPPPLPRPPVVAHVPKKENEGNAEWVTGAWTPCSRTCGTGERYRSVGCRGRSKGEYLAHSACAVKPKPHERDTCFIKECGTWQFGEWGTCTASCDDGLGGAMQRRYVACVVDTKPIKDEDECDKNTRPAASRLCPDLPACQSQIHMRMIENRMSGVEQLQLERYESYYEPAAAQYIEAATPEPTRPPVRIQQGVWITGGWGKCSRPCGGGIRNRLVACQMTSSLEGYDTVECEESKKPANISRCNDQPCPEWKFGQWGPCNKTCGTGFQRRMVQCVDSRGAHMASHQCPRPHRPANIRRCNEDPCEQDDAVNSITGQYPPSTSIAVWQAGHWSSCSVTCGRGVRQRLVVCIDQRTKRITNDSICSDEKPAATEECRLDACPKWRVTRWSPCSNNCGSGAKTREVLCAKGGLGQQFQGSMVRVDDTLCQNQRKPKGERSCEAYDCDDSVFRWDMSRWSPCSASCDIGKQTRTVRCIYKANNTAVDLIHCRKGSQTMPPVKRVCKTGKSCSFRWITGEWSECSKTCGSGVRWRHVNCHKVDENGVTIWWPTESPYRCDTRNKPKDRQLCSFGRCNDHFLWRADPWMECTKSCDGGVAKRAVHCVHLKTQQRLRPSFCRANLKPESTKNCNPEPCSEKRNRE